MKMPPRGISPYLEFVFPQLFSLLPHRCSLAALQRLQAVAAARFEAEMTCVLWLHQAAAEALRRSPPLRNILTVH